MRKLSRSPCDASSHHSAILYGCDGVDLLWGDSVLFEEPFDDAAEATPYFDPSSVNDQDGSLSPAATPDESFAVIPGSRSHDSSQADSASQSQCRSDDDRALCSPPARRLASCYVADRQLVLLRVASNGLILPLARAAAAFVKRSSWSPIGYKRCNDFTRERLGRSRRWLTDLAALGEGFDRLPSLKSAVSGEDGGAPLSRVVATALARYATAEVVDEWIELARSVTVREFMETLKQARETGSSRPILEGEASDRQTRIDAEDEDDDDETTDRIDVRMLVPESIRIAFEETLDLHRAVSGYQATIGSFAEALAAEAAAGPEPLDVGMVKVRTGIPIRDIEMAHARDTDNWRVLRAMTDAADVCRRFEAQQMAGAQEPLVGLVEQTLLAVLELEKRAGEGDEHELADQLARCVHLEDELEIQTGKILRQMAQRADWQTLGFADTSHYAAERLGMARRTAASRTGLDRALCERPHVRAADEEGKIGLDSTWLTCRALGRGRIEEKSETSWVGQACEATVKRMRDEVRRTGLCYVEALLKGTGIVVTSPLSGWPGDDGKGPFRKVIPPATDAEWHASIRRQPSMTRDRVRWLGKAGTHPRMADVCLRLRLKEDIANIFAAAMESARRRLEEMIDPWTEGDDARASVCAAREHVARGRRVPGWVGLLEMLEGYAETWDDPQLIPKRRWSRIYERDGYRCMAPGCTARAQIQDHHIEYRSHQGSHEPWNQMALCSFHHLQGEHGRFARVRGKAPLDAVWRLGTPELATWWKNERRLTPEEAMLAAN